MINIYDNEHKNHKLIEMGSNNKKICFECSFNFLLKPSPLFTKKRKIVEVLYHHIKKDKNDSFMVSKFIDVLSRETRDVEYVCSILKCCEKIIDENFQVFICFIENIFDNLKKGLNIKNLIDLLCVMSKEVRLVEHMLRHYKTELSTVCVQNLYHSEEEIKSYIIFLLLQIGKLNVKSLEIIILQSSREKIIKNFDKKKINEEKNHLIYIVNLLQNTESEEIQINVLSLLNYLVLHSKSEKIQRILFEKSQVDQSIISVIFNQNINIQISSLQLLLGCCSKSKFIKNKVVNSDLTDFLFEVLRSKTLNLLLYSTIFKIFDILKDKQLFINSYLSFGVETIVDKIDDIKNEEEESKIGSQISLLFMTNLNEILYPILKETESEIWKKNYKKVSNVFFLKSSIIIDFIKKYLEFEDCFKNVNTIGFLTLFIKTQNDLLNDETEAAEIQNCFIILIKHWKNLFQKKDENWKNLLNLILNCFNVTLKKEKLPFILYNFFEKFFSSILMPLFFSYLLPENNFTQNFNEKYVFFCFQFLLLFYKIKNKKNNNEIKINFKEISEMLLKNKIVRIVFHTLETTDDEDLQAICYQVLKEIFSPLIIKKDYNERGEEDIEEEEEEEEEKKKKKKKGKEEIDLISEKEYDNFVNYIEKLPYRKEDFLDILREVPNIESFKKQKCLITLLYVTYFYNDFFLCEHKQLIVYIENFFLKLTTNRKIESSSDYSNYQNYLNFSSKYNIISKLLQILHIIAKNGMNLNENLVKSVLILISNVKLKLDENVLFWLIKHLSVSFNNNEYFIPILNKLISFNINKEEKRFNEKIRSLIINSNNNNGAGKISKILVELLKENKTNYRELIYIFKHLIEFIFSNKLALSSVLYYEIKNSNLWNVLDYIYVANNHHQKNKEEEEEDEEEPQSTHFSDNEFKSKFFEFLNFLIWKLYCYHKIHNDHKLYEENIPIFQIFLNFLKHILNYISNNIKNLENLNLNILNSLNLILYILGIEFKNQNSEDIYEILEFYQAHIIQYIEFILLNINNEHEKDETQKKNEININNNNNDDDDNDNDNDKIKNNKFYQIKYIVNLQFIIILKEIEVNLDLKLFQKKQIINFFLKNFSNLSNLNVNKNLNLILFYKTINKKIKNDNFENEFFEDQDENEDENEDDEEMEEFFNDNYNVQNLIFKLQNLLILNDKNLVLNSQKTLKFIIERMNLNNPSLFIWNQFILRFLVQKVLNLLLKNTIKINDFEMIDELSIYLNCINFFTEFQFIGNSISNFYSSKIFKVIINFINQYFLNKDNENFICINNIQNLNFLIEAFKIFQNFVGFNITVESNNNNESNYIEKMNEKIKLITNSMLDKLEEEEEDYSENKEGTLIRGGGNVKRKERNIMIKKVRSDLYFFKELQKINEISYYTNTNNNNDKKKNEDILVENLKDICKGIIWIVSK